ncbi:MULTISPECIES: hypothetical protein [Actinomadura]|uniref:hypothetical protein n=1 Tax=Actinomadura TaxID=1988 RepID=UPI00040F8063|nr:MULTISPECIES: hypothetical protein [Actinomadura]RSN52474.1 hypothetical protein DMH08_28670 [Actinomadura sp. WAC 06369]
MTNGTTDPTTRTGRRRAPRAPARAAGAAATAVSIATTAVVAILAVHILFTVFEANTANGIVEWFAGAADRLAWQFEDVFRPDDPKVAVAVNHGLAAAVYLAAGRLAAALVRRLA